MPKLYSLADWLALYRLRTVIRANLPWWLIRLGVAGKGCDCEARGGLHDRYNRDGRSSACYHCRIVRAGQP